MSGPAQEPILVASFPKNTIERVVVKLDTFKGTATIHIRTEYRDPDGRWLATKQGLAIALPHLPALADALQQALAVALQTGRLPGA